MGVRLGINTTGGTFVKGGSLPGTPFCSGAAPLSETKSPRRARSTTITTIKETGQETLGIRTVVAFQLDGAPEFRDFSEEDAVLELGESVLSSAAL